MAELTTLSLAGNGGLTGDMTPLFDMAIPNLVTDCPLNQDVICLCCEACCSSTSSGNTANKDSPPGDDNGGGETDDSGSTGNSGGEGASLCGFPFFLPDAMAYTRRFTFTTCCGRRMCGRFTCTD